MMMLFLTFVLWALCFLSAACVYAWVRLCRLERKCNMVMIVGAAVTMQHGRVRSDGRVELAAQIVEPPGDVVFSTHFRNEDVCMLVEFKPPQGRRRRKTEPVKVDTGMALALM